MDEVRFPLKTTRDFLRILEHYDESVGLEPLLQAVERKGLIGRKLDKLLKGRFPGEEKGWSGADPIKYMQKYLNGRIFPTRIRPMMAEGFPEKRRLFFVHVPKCAGTDLTLGLKRRGAILAAGVADEFGYRKGAASLAEVCTSIKEWIAASQDSDSIAFVGHERLRYYLKHNLVRKGDHVFTVVREPNSRVYSRVNYFLKICVDRETRNGVHAQKYLRFIGVEALPRELTPDVILEIGRKILYCPELIPANDICNYLGTKQATSEAAIRTAVAANMEITDIRHYSAWRKQRLGLGESMRANTSIQYLTPQNATDADRAYIQDINREDHLLYTRIIERLEKSGGLSITGADLA